ncbi:MAG: DUF262 domain-containing protein [Planctomycetota bacterium]
MTNPIWVKKHAEMHRNLSLESGYRMSLEEEIEKASAKISKDGYEMSIGELMSLYSSKELIINPKYLRYFRWDISQKTRFIESLILGIPVPPIFVFTSGKRWELVDGLQRMATIFEFAGLLIDSTDTKGKRLVPPSVLEGTEFLPSLSSKRWEESAENAGDGLSDDLKFEIKRSRIRVEILKKGTDPLTKFELFQRLNSSGSPLSEQELRSCTIVMINEELFGWMEKLSKSRAFVKSIGLTKRAIARQKSLEFLLRYLSYRNRPYKIGIDVHDYLDASAISLASDPDFDRSKEEDYFKRTFTLLSDALGTNVFRKWDGATFSRQSSLSAFEYVTHGVSLNIDSILMLGTAAKDFVEARVKSIWADPGFKEHSKAGVRGTTRLANLLPKAGDFFKP